MKKRQRNRLTEPQKVWVVQQLACWESLTDVKNRLQDEFGVDLAVQNIQHYDPTKTAGRKLSKHLRGIFETTRKNFLAQVESHIPHANKAVRIAKLAKAADAFERKGNYIGMQNCLESIAKEMGNVHTNKREFTGKDGGPIQFADLSDDELDQRLATILALPDTDVHDSNPAAQPAKPH